MNGEPPEKDSSTPRTREARAPLLLGNWQDIDDQRKEGVDEGKRDSDPPIVVRDGNTGHTAKEWAGGNASKALTTGHVDPDILCHAPCLHWRPVLLLCDRLGFMCALSEEPGAVIPHAGICEGGVG